ncbi:MAG: hypothetical protein JO149_04925, partial [Gammaproteobacteria bacterium]|nr:hypothetical protein [Gammaproteobacteria bacterium]
TAPLTAPLFYLIALSNMCGSNVIKNTPKYKANECRKLLHELKVKDKKLKTILFTDPTFVGDIAHAHDIHGAYTFQHSLFATVENEKNILKEFKSEIVEILKSIDPTLKSISIATIFHEAAHYAALEVMNNSNDTTPFEKNDLETRNEYLSIFHNIKKVHQTWIANNKQETIAILSISMAFDKFYRDTKQPNELFVKIPEIIGFLGYQNGLTVLNKFVPTLVEFYEKKFNPACIKYLVKNKLEMLIAVDPYFSNELKRYKIRSNLSNKIELGIFGSSSALSTFDASKDLQNEYSKFSKNL